MKGAASALWTQDLLTVLEGTLRSALPPDHACDSPPAPATPPQGAAHVLPVSRMPWPKLSGMPAQTKLSCQQTELRRLQRAALLKELLNHGALQKKSRG